VPLISGTYLTSTRTRIPYESPDSGRIPETPARRKQVSVTHHISPAGREYHKPDGTMQTRPLGLHRY